MKNPFIILLFAFLLLCDASPSSSMSEYPSVNLLTPNDSTAIEIGKTYDITWTASDASGFNESNYISIYLTTNEGASWDLITGSEENDGGDSGSFPWMVPDIPAQTCRISIEAVNVMGYKGYDVSDHSFSIQSFQGIAYVSPNGSDSNNGSSASPFYTINKGLSSVGSGGTVILRPGKYNYNSFPINWPDRNDITLQGAGAYTSIISSDTMGFERIIAVDFPVRLTIEALSVRGINADIGGSGGINISNNSATVEVRDCVFYNNYSMAGGGIYNKGNLSAYNSIFVKNNSGNGGDGIYNEGGSCFASNCTFYKNSSNSVYTSSGSTFNAVNCIFWNNPYGLGGDGSGTLKNCAIGDAIAVGLSTIECISIDPVFASTNESNENDFLRLGAGSPYIDSGTYEAWTTSSSDANGDKRPHNWLADIGAYEFQGPSIKVISPNGGESITAETTTTIRWVATDESGIKNNKVNLRFSSDGGASWSLIGNVANTGSYVWTVPNIESYYCLVSVEAFNNKSISNVHSSDHPFLISYIKKMLYISPSGNDGNSGLTPSNPRLHIQNALNSIEAGGTIRFAAGTYMENSIIWPNKDNITLLGAGYGMTTIDAQYPSPDRVFSVDYPVCLTLEGLTIKNAIPQIAQPGGVINCTTNSRINVRNCLFTNNIAYRSVGGFLAFPFNVNGTCEAYNCIFMNNNAYSGGVAYGGTWNAVNCIFYNNNAPDGSVAHFGNWKAINCIFFKNPGSLILSCDSFTCVNSIFWSNPNILFSNITSPPNISYSDIQPSDWLAGPGNISAEPLFISTNEANVADLLSLDIRSVCINAGTVEPCVPLTDIKGNKRPHNWLADIGAYEFQGPSVRIVYPNGGEQFTQNTIAQIRWVATDEAGIVNNRVTLRYSVNPGETWSQIASAPNTGSYNWTTPVANSNNCLISIEAKNNLGIVNSDKSNSAFKITPLILYVSISGNNNNDGSLSRPFKTIQHALNMIPSGGKVIVQPGWYWFDGPNEESFPITWPNKNNITLIGTGQGSTTIDAQGLPPSRVISINYPVNLTIEGVTIKNGASGGNGGGIYLTAGSSLELISSAIKNNSANDALGGGIYGNGATLIIRECVFSGNTCEVGGGPNNGGGAINFGATGTGKIINSLFYDNRTKYSGGSSWIYGGAIYGGNNIDIMNCVFYRNTLTNSSFPDQVNGSALYGGTYNINNCIFDDNGPSVPNNNDILASSGSLRYSVVTSGKYEGVSMTNCSSLSPYFVNPSGLDLHLNITSECINGGTFEGAPSKDIEGNRRPQGRKHDLGAYEFVINRPQILKNTIRIDGYSISELVGMSNRPVLDYDFTDEYSSYRSPSAEVVLNGRTYSITPEPVTGSPNTYHIAFSSDSTLEAGRYSLVLRVTNFLGESDEFTKTLSSGILSVSGKPKNVPNPFRPGHGEGTTFIYKLTSDSNIKMIIYDITGKAVVQRSFSAGANGGKLGDNNVYWDGRTDFDEYAANGVYVYIIIDSNNKVLSKGQITVTD